MNTGGIEILATGRALPVQKVSNGDMEKLVETSDSWIVSRTGIHSRYRCSGEESCLTLAAKAAEQALTRSGVQAEQVGLIIVATSSGDWTVPSAACLIQQRLGLPEEVMAFDLGAGCAGFLAALQAAAGILPTLEKPCALIIGAEELSRIVDYTDRNTCVLFGDGAGAAVVRASGKPLYRKSWSRGDEEALSCPGPGRERRLLSMDGHRVFRFAVAALKQALLEVLESAGCGMEDVDYVVCHQANERIIRHVQRQFPGQEQKFVINLAEYGNTSAASIPIALDELSGSGKLKRGMRVLLAAFGAGLCWNSMLLEW